MKPLVLSSFLLALSLVAIPAAAGTLFDNGPTNGTIDAWTINFGFTLSDRFEVSPRGGTVTGVQFAAWLSPGDILISAEVSMTSDELGGTVYFRQTVDFTQSGCSVNGYSYDVCTETANFSGPTLPAGQYWMNLENAVDTQGDPVYWDENDGPAYASENSLGSIPSESFTILGNPGTTTGTTPEPGSIFLFGSGVLGVMSRCIAGFSRKVR